jgi:hypothetical protein
MSSTTASTTGDQWDWLPRRKNAPGESDWVIVDGKHAQLPPNGGWNADLDLKWAIMTRWNNAAVKNNVVKHRVERRYQPRTQKKKNANAHRK